MVFPKMETLFIRNTGTHLQCQLGKSSARFNVKDPLSLRGPKDLRIELNLWGKFPGSASDNDRFSTQFETLEVLSNPCRDSN